MKKITVQFTFLEYSDSKELTNTEQELLEAARKAVGRAYAPYSEFYVGAAVLLENGMIITGNNQENAAYPSGLCAERVTLFAASAQYPDVPFIALAISARSSHFNIINPVGPCGACRQVINEYEDKQQKPIKIILSGEKGKVRVIENIADLLPLKFDAEALLPKDKSR